jgi:colicin import membrane protein
MWFTRKKYRGGKGPKPPKAAKKPKAPKATKKAPKQTKKAPKQTKKAAKKAPKKAPKQTKKAPKAPSAAKKAKGEAKQAATKKAKAERSAQKKADRAKNKDATKKANANAKAKRAEKKAEKKNAKTKRAEAAKKKKADADAAKKKKADADAATKKKKADADAAKKKKADAAAKKKGAAGFFVGPMGALGSGLSALGNLADKALNDMMNGLDKMIPDFGGSFGSPSGSSSVSGMDGSTMASPDIAAPELSGDSTCSPAQKGAKQAADAARQKALDKIPYSTSTPISKLTEIDKVWKKSIDAAKISGDCGDNAQPTQAPSSSATVNKVSDEDFLTTWKASIDYIDAPEITPNTPMQSITFLIKNLIRTAYTDDDKRKINVAARVILNPMNIKRYLALLAKSKATKIPLYPSNS